MIGLHVENADILSLREKGKKEPPLLLKVEGLLEKEPNPVIKLHTIFYF
jgi:hypothetical protein